MKKFGILQSHTYISNFIKIGAILWSQALYTSRMTHPDRYHSENQFFLELGILKTNFPLKTLPNNVAKSLNYLIQSQN